MPAPVDRGLKVLVLLVESVTALLPALRFSSGYADPHPHRVAVILVRTRSRLCALSLAAPVGTKWANCRSCTGRACRDESAPRRDPRGVKRSTGAEARRWE